MNFIRLGTRFINLERVIDAEICLDENGERGIMLRYVVSDITSNGNMLLTMTVTGTDAEALEMYLNECGVVLTFADPLPVEPCLSNGEAPVPTILDM